MKPFKLTRLLYQLQHFSQDDIAYDMDDECFIIEVLNLPSEQRIFPMAEDMLQETRKIEQNLISKLNCTYLAARQVSMPTIEYMMNKEAELDDPTDFFKGFSVKINELINRYFSANYDDVEIAVAGGEKERNETMPLLYVDRDDCEHEKDAIRDVLDEAHSGESDEALEKVGNRMKPIDVVKVLMGIHSQKEHIKRFMYKSPLWQKL